MITTLLLHGANPNFPILTFPLFVAVVDKSEVLIDAQAGNLQIVIEWLKKAQTLILM